MRLHHARLEENSHLLKPPVGNYCVYNDDFAVMASLSPDTRYPIINSQTLH